jgi:hypothetical protein
MSRRRSDATPAWVIRSVAVRTRDGPERLDQAYRRLMGAPSRDDPPPAPGYLSEQNGAALAPESRT